MHPCNGSMAYNVRVIHVGLRYLPTTDIPKNQHAARAQCTVCVDSCEFKTGLQMGTVQPTAHNEALLRVCKTAARCPSNIHNAINAITASHTSAESCSNMFLCKTNYNVSYMVCDRKRQDLPCYPCKHSLLVSSGPCLAQHYWQNVPRPPSHHTHMHNNGSLFSASTTLSAGQPRYPTVHMKGG